MPPVRLRIAIVADAQAVLAVLLQGVTSLAFHTSEVEDVDDGSGHDISAKETIYMVVMVLLATGNSLCL